MPNEISIITLITRSELGKTDIKISRVGAGDDPLEMAADHFEKSQRQVLLDLVKRNGGTFKTIKPLQS